MNNPLHVHSKPLKVASISSSSNTFLSYKTSELLKGRRIEDNLRLAGTSPKAQKQLTVKLSLLQRTIYALDCYGETSWDIEHQVLEVLWQNIYGQLMSWELTLKDAGHLLEDMQAYQQVELQLRKGVLPTSLPLEEFYYLKTCDVRLSRKLIATSSKGLCTDQQLLLWNCFDIISEVYDDLSDIEEDLFDFNCNRFLFQKSLYGGLCAQHDYEKYLDKIKDQMMVQLKACEDSITAYYIDRYFNIKLAQTRLLLSNRCKANELTAKIIKQVNAFT